MEKIYPDAGHKRIIEEKTKKVNNTAIGGIIVPNGGSQEIFACMVTILAFSPSGWTGSSFAAKTSDWRRESRRIILILESPMKLIDLSHPLEHGQLNFPFDPKITVLIHNTIASIGYNMTQISMATHQGTHLDVPFHFYDDGETVERVPLDRFYGPAALVDLAPGAYLEAKTPITVEMLEPHAEKFQPGAKIVYRTGWDRTFGTPECFSDFPTLTLEAAKWIAQRRIGLLGMDTLTPSTDWKEVHLTLLAKGVEIVIVEGLTNLEQLPERFTLAAFPLKITGRDGSPIRAVGIVD
jgi:kynurenine formamidase